MYEIKKEESGSKAEIELSGCITIQNALELKETITCLYKEVNNIVIDQSKAEEMDLSYLQILISLKSFMLSMGKNLTLKGAESPAFAALLQQSGYVGDNFCEENRQSILKGQV